MFILEYIRFLDTVVVEYFFTRHTQFLDILFLAVTWCGNTEVVISLATLCFLLLCFKKQYTDSFRVLVIVVGSTLSTHLLKFMFVRPRPDLLVHHLESFSFPSGHATGAIALYGAIAYILLRSAKKNIQRKLIIACAVFIVLLIGFSRIYLGYHYLSDVLAGYIVGALWLCVVTQFSRRRHVV